MSAYLSEKFDQIEKVRLGLANEGQGDRGVKLGELELPDSVQMIRRVVHIFQKITNIRLAFVRVHVKQVVIYKWLEMTRLVKLVWSMSAKDRPEPRTYQHSRRSSKLGWVSRQSFQLCAQAPGISRFKSQAITNDQLGSIWKSSYFNGLLVLLIELVETQSQWDDEQQRRPLFAYLFGMKFAFDAFVAGFHRINWNKRKEDQSSSSQADRIDSDILISSMKRQLSMAM